MGRETADIQRLGLQSEVVLVCPIRHRVDIECHAMAEVGKNAIERSEAG
jgi:hypothetical protein